MLDIKRVDTNTSEIEAYFSLDVIVETFSMRVGLEGGLPSVAPGTTVRVEWAPPNEDGTPSGATVRVLTDHNYVAPAADPQPVTVDPSLKPDAPKPATPFVMAAAPAPIPPAAGLQIPGSPAA